MTDGFKTFILAFVVDPMNGKLVSDVPVTYNVL